MLLGRPAYRVEIGIPACELARAFDDAEILQSRECKPEFMPWFENETSPPLFVFCGERALSQIIALTKFNGRTALDLVKT
jgi:hypothetical protein